MPAQYHELHYITGASAMRHRTALHDGGLQDLRKLVHDSRPMTCAMVGWLVSWFV